MGVVTIYRLFLKHGKKVAVSAYMGVVTFILPLHFQKCNVAVSAYMGVVTRLTVNSK